MKFLFLEKNKLSIESPSPRRAWIEIFAQAVRAAKLASPSPRRAWIEMPISEL